jgi:alpha-glucuronidase
MKQNPCSVVSEMTKPSRIGFDALDGTFETFSAGVSHFVLTEVKPSSLMSFKDFDNFFDGLALTAYGASSPNIKETIRRTFVAVVPQVADVFFNRSRAIRFEVEVEVDSSCEMLSLRRCVHLDSF